MFQFDKKDYGSERENPHMDGEYFKKRERFKQYYQSLNRNNRESIVNGINNMGDFLKFLNKEKISLKTEYSTSDGEQVDDVTTHFIPICLFITDEGIMKHIVALEPNSAYTHFSRLEYEELSVPLTTLGVTSSDSKDFYSFKILESNEILIRDDLDQEWGEFIMVFNMDVNDTKIKELRDKYINL